MGFTPLRRRAIPRAPGRGSGTSEGRNQARKDRVARPLAVAVFGRL